jgi:hypothetical protein
MRLFVYECWKCPKAHPITMREAFSLWRYDHAKVLFKMTRQAK